MMSFLSHRLIAFIILLSLLSTARAEHPERLPPSVTQALTQAGVPLSATAVIIQDTQAVQPSVSLNTGRAFNPASVMKLLTTFAALDMLGPSYTWQTSAHASAMPREGVLDADLVLRGGGDPHLTFEQFWLLLRQLRAAGVRDIRGDLVLDRTLFNLPEDPVSDAATPFDDQPLRPYNVSPDALLLNFKAVRLKLVGDTASASLAIRAEPQPSNLDIINHIQPIVAERSCDAWKEGLHAALDFVQNRYRLTLSGNYPLSCGEKLWNLGVLPHPHYVYGVFNQLWHELGGTLSGHLRTSLPATPPDTRHTLAHIESRTLAEIIRDINKYSNNVMARQLFLTLGIAPHGPDAPLPLPRDTKTATEIQANANLRFWLRQKQLDFPELILENGSGLSRHERISATSLARLLDLAWKSPLMPEFIASLPLVAVDGTMKKRLQHTGIAGQAHIKTGTLDGVKTMAGYVLDHRGRWQIVVFLVNHPNAATTQAAQDALLQWVYQR